MARHAKESMRRSRGTLLISGGFFIAIALGLTTAMRASDNLDYEIAGQIRDIVWDSRLFDGTPQFPGAILWFHNPSGMPGNFTQASFEASTQAAFDAWKGVDNGVPEEPLVPVVNFGGQTAVTDVFALDGVNAVAWQPESPGGTLAVTPCWALDAPTTTTTDATGQTVLPVDGGSSIPFPGPAGVTYPEGTIIDCGMRFDSSDPWSTTEIPDPFGFDVQAIATHEGGHFIGISHSTLGDFTAVDPASATMLPLVAPGDSTYRTLEEDDKASVLRVYARNRFGAPLPQTIGGRGVVTLRLLKDGECVAATGVSVVAYPTQSGIDGPNRVETFSGSHLRGFTPHQPFDGSVTLNLAPLPAGESYTIYARTLEAGTGALSAQRYNYTTINSNLIDSANQSRTFDQLVTIESLAAGESLNLGNVGILGCWTPNPNSQVNLVAQSITAPATAFKGGQIAVSSTFSNQGTVAAGAFEAGMYFSTDQTITSSDIYSGFTCAVPGLASGAVAACDGSAPVPGAVVPGNYYVGLLVDRTNQVIENAESDNGVAAATVTSVAPNPFDPIVNGSFETGDLTGWTVKELTPASNPSLPLSAHPAGVEYPAAQFIAWPYILDYFTSAPTDGLYAALNDFNGNDPATSGPINRRELYQDITLPANTTTLEFDYRAAWELFRFGSTLDRTFSVEIGPAGGGTPILTQTILVAPNLTIEEDTDNPTGGVGDYPPAIVDLSAFSTQSVRLKFVWNIPEPGTGFGFFQLDNVRLNTSSVSNTPPTVTITSPATGSTFEQGSSITFTGTATDSPDGNISSGLSWSSDRDGVIGSGASVSTSGLSGGSHVITASVTDSGGLQGSAAVSIVVNAENVEDVENLATADVSTSPGTIASGSYQQTTADDQDYEVLTETLEGNNPNRRRSQLEHTWRFEVAAGSQYVFTVNAHRTGTEDDFTFSYSRDNVVFTPMATVTAATDTTQTFAFPEDVAGPVYVRVQDTDNRTGNVQLDSLFVDFMSITTTFGGGGGGGGTSVTLSAAGYKVKGIQHVELTWSGATTSLVTIARDGVVIRTVSNPAAGDGTYVDNIGTKGSGTYTYQVCESGTGGACSNAAAVTF
jgi:hypothetical protein